MICHAAEYQTANVDRNHAILRFPSRIGVMVDTGLVDYWRRKWSPERRQCDPDEGQGSRVIGLADTQTAFYLAALGVGLAAVALGTERLWDIQRNSSRPG